MPIIQQSDPWASILGGLIGGAGNFIAARNQARGADQVRKDKLAQQTTQNNIAQGNLDVQRSNAGMVKLPDGSYGPDPRIAGMLAAIQPQGQAPQQAPATQPGASPPKTLLPGQKPLTPVGPGVTNALPPGIMGAATGAAVAATPSRPTPQQFTQQAQGELSAADKLETQIRGFIGVPGPQAREVVTALTQEANQHRQRAQSLFQQAGRAKTEADVDATKQLTADEDAFAAKEMPLTGDPKKDLPILRKRLAIERGHGFRGLVGDTQKNITDDENRIHQDTVDAENRAAQAANRGQRQQSIDIRLNGQNAGGDDSQLEAAMRHVKGMKTADAISYLNTLPLSNKEYDRAMKGVTALGTANKPKLPPLAQQIQADFDQALTIYNAPNQTDTGKQKIVNRFAASHKLTPDKAQAYFDNGG